MLTDGTTLSVTRRVTLHLNCPRCDADLDVTNIQTGLVIECPACRNRTLRPDYTPKWYHRLRNFVLANVGSFILGTLASLLATYLWETHIRAAAPSAPIPSVIPKQPYKMPTDNYGLDIPTAIFTAEWRIIVLEQIVEKMLPHVAAGTITAQVIEQIKEKAFKDMKKRYPKAGLTRHSGEGLQ